MKGSAVAKEVVEPYAQALMAIAQSQDLVDKFNEDAAYLLDLFNSSSELQQFLANPFTPVDAKKAVLEQIGSDQVHPTMQNFMRLLVDRGRVLFLGGVCKQYQSLVRELRQVVLAEVTSAVELNDEQKEAVRQKVLQLLDVQQVELETSVNPDLIGGVIIQVGSQVFDASLRGQLRRLGVSLSSSI